MFSCPSDQMSAAQLRSMLLAFAAATEPSIHTKVELDNYYSTITPRSIFFKNLPRNATLLDLGAGNGTMSVFKEWPSYKRPDIKMYATSLEKGELFDKYHGYEISNFEKQFPDFPGISLDAVLCAHFIEHLRSPERCIKWISDRLTSGRRLYLEWPHAISKKLPSGAAVRAAGLNVTTVNFSDDRTHVEPWDFRRIKECLSGAQFQIESAGRIHMPYLSSALRNCGKETGDQVYGTFSIWTLVGWAQYIVASKI